MAAAARRYVHAPDHDGGSELWYPLEGNAAWRTRNLLEATGADFEEIDSGEVAIDDDGKERKLYGYSFDSDDLPGATFVVDCTQRTYEGKIGNDFANDRAVGEAAPKARADKPAAAAAAKPAEAAATPARTPTAAAGGVTRRPRA
jgi:hypothetical protein